MGLARALANMLGEGCKGPSLCVLRNRNQTSASTVSGAVSSAVVEVGLVDSKTNKTEIHTHNRLDYVPAPPIAAHTLSHTPVSSFRSIALSVPALRVHPLACPRSAIIIKFETTGVAAGQDTVQGTDRSCNSTSVCLASIHSSACCIERYSLSQALYARTRGSALRPHCNPRAAIMSHPGEVDPRQFLERMRTLSDQRDQQDAERVKKLEEELIQGRSERLARRAGMPPPVPVCVCVSCALIK